MMSRDASHTWRSRTANPLYWGLLILVFFCFGWGGGRRSLFFLYWNIPQSAILVIKAPTLILKAVSAS